ncbi:glucosylceramidase protein [Trichomonas vaginalis G3]|nr:glucosylceramidase protein [Trichomonas vaginalis G3]KAI5506922.1 glucosylceramidase protein [Trichomonas vaginalis G3]
MWNTREIGIGTLNKGSKCAIMWNLLLDTNHGPYRPNGCSNSYGAVDVKVPGYSELIYRSHYYDMAHLSKVIKPDSIRLGTTVSGSSNVYATSAINTNGFIGAVLLNDQDQDVTVSVHCGSHAFDVPMSKRSVVSVIWKQ